MTFNHCRLCLTDTGEHVDIFGYAGTEKNICKIIKQHFSFITEIKENDLFSKKICTTCWFKIDNFHEFYLNVKIKQDSFGTLNDANPLLQAIKIEDEQQHYEPIGNFLQVEIEKKEYELDIPKDNEEKLHDNNNQIMDKHEWLNVNSDNVNENNYSSNSNNSGNNVINAYVDVPDEHNNNDVNNDDDDDDDDSEFNDEEPLSKIIVKRRNKNSDKFKSKLVKKRKKKETGVSKVKKTREENPLEDRPKANKLKDETTDKDQKPSNVLPKFANVNENEEDDDDDDEDNEDDENELYSSDNEVDGDVPNPFKIEDELIRQYCTMACDLCTDNKIFSQFLDIKEHYRIEHQLPGYVVCCNKKFSRRGRIMDHISWHKNPEEFTCKICNKLYRDKYTLKIHMLNHIPTASQFKCETCGKSFTQQQKLDKHKVWHTYTVDDKKFKCPHCESAFVSQAILTGHVRRVHFGSETTVCDICARIFKTRISFERHHAEIHLGIKPQKIQCQICGAWLKNKRCWQRHCQRHEDAQNGKTEYVCELCGKKAPNRQALRSHVKYVHITQRNHQCTFCDKAFKRPKELREHMSTHTGEALYTCPFCPKTFSSNANMHSHKNKEHKYQWEEFKRHNLNL